MITLLADNDVRGAFRRMNGIWQSEEWRYIWDYLDIQLADFRSLQLAADASDRAIWMLCQEKQIVLVTGNRNLESADSLEATLREMNTIAHLPVITLVDQRRVGRDVEYARRAAIGILDILLDLESRRGAGRLFVP